LPANTFGSIFRLTTFGESHGVAIGGILDGCPAGLKLDLDAIQKMVDRRRPGQSPLTTDRKETDRVEILSGILDGVTLGTPIGFIIRNKDQKPADYDALKNIYRPGHADFTWETKYGIRDHRGGGRASARETACRVVGGAIAMQFLKHFGVEVNAWTSTIGPVSLPEDTDLDYDLIYSNDVRTCNLKFAESMSRHILTVKEAGDSCGGIVTGMVRNLPAGIGEPVFGKLPALLAKAMMGIHATKGFEMGSGFKSAAMRGSEHNDAPAILDGKPVVSTNHAGGTHGGISNGQDILFKVAFKPVSSIAIPQTALDKDGNAVELKIEGRHDPCVVPRAVPIVESMTALVLADLILMNKLSRI
jgi:chorismate synthase